MLKQGLYEQIINRLLRTGLESSTDLDLHKGKVDREEASGILARYIQEIVEKRLMNLRDNGEDLSKQIDLTNKIVKLLSNNNDGSEPDSFLIDEPFEQLLALIDPNNSYLLSSPKGKPVRPETSLSESSIFTASEDEPTLMDELQKEILTSDRVDMLVSFIKWSGLRIIIDQLKAFTDHGGHLRIITTSYMGATDPKAIAKLNELKNTEIKISYDTKRTRLHAKAYVFHRETGFSTAYIGSSNLSNAAITSGLEWNVKITSKDLPSTMRKVCATFDSYWNDNDFELYSEDEKERLVKALKMENSSDSIEVSSHFFDIRPYPYQQEILDKLDAERKVVGNYKNLVVSATGTGKTVISAFDYKRFCEENKERPRRLLFIAHREEILQQSVECFRGVLKDYNFGDLYVGKFKPISLDNLFVSIQTFNSQKLYEKTPPDYYDFIIVDEFHHAAASSYQKLISYYKPKVLLGLTATPERMDGKSILRYFDNHIAAEIRLPQAIDRKLLSPFQYFGVTDSVDLTGLKWSRGGYDESQLTELYAYKTDVAERRADLIIKSVIEYVTDINDVKGLGFCVSVAHAEFMANFFSKSGIGSIALTGNSPDEVRKQAKEKLVSGDIKFIFVVDIYNEGVDIPEINTILFLRPTESLTIFLQQLGRGLRISEGKECLTVLDFIGQANTKYNFEEKFAALVSKTSRSIMKQVKEGFVHLPRGSYIHLERKAKEYILENIKKSFGVRSGLKERIASFEDDTGFELTLENFLVHYHLDPLDIYSKSSFSRLCTEAKLIPDFQDQEEATFTKALVRISEIDSRRWIHFLLNVFDRIENLELNDLSDSENRMLQMFHYTVWQKPLQECGFSDLRESIMRIRRCEPLYQEMKELLEFNLTRIDFVDEPVDLGFDCPLDLHCNYSRDQLLVAMDFMNPATIREGVKYLPEKNADVLLITLNKSDKDYSPSTMYNDYSISDTFFHWQSQSTTSEFSPTGQRYINHKATGGRILLFVREYKKNIAGGALPYTFLGLADYIEHEGSKPMNIIWKLEKPIPAKYLKKTNKLVIR